MGLKRRWKLILDFLSSFIITKQVERSEYVSKRGKKQKGKLLTLAKKVLCLSFLFYSSNNFTYEMDPAFLILEYPEIREKLWRLDYNLVLRLSTVSGFPLSFHFRMEIVKIKSWPRMVFTLKGKIRGSLWLLQSSELQSSSNSVSLSVNQETFVHWDVHKHFGLKNTGVNKVLQAYLLRFPQNISQNTFLSPTMGNLIFQEQLTVLVSSGKSFEK